MTSDTSYHPVPAPSSGAKADEWRAVAHHSEQNAPLDDGGGPRRRADRPVATVPPRGRREWSALGVLLAATSLLYIWGLGASGYANDFYAAAVQAGTKSWKAFFFGSLDSNNVITVDKPPASLWPMELSGRIFGFSSWSMLLPEAIMGVLSVWLLYATVRRWFGPAAGLLAGALLAVTPVAVLMFRFNNPDAMMVLLIVLAAYCVTRALEAASTKWLLFAGLVMGFSFLVKGLQPFTVLPALAVAYLVAAPTSLRRRLLQLLGSAVAIVVGAGWWILAVDLTPAADRPYIGGSGDNSALGLAFGYNGFSRISGGSSGPGGGGGASFSGATGIGRLFNSLNGGQISWLLPAALIAIVALGVASARAARVDRTRAALLIWGGWLLITAVVLSFASGTIHTYYTVELAPAIAALVAVAAVVLWRRRAELAARIGLAAGVLVTAWWSKALLGRSSDWYPWLATLLLVAGVVGAIALVVRKGRSLAVVGVAAGLIAISGGSVAYALDTAATPHTGSTPSAGPTAGDSFGGGFGGRFGGTGGPGGGTGGFGGNRGPGGTGGFTPPSGGTGGFTPPTNSGSAGSGSTGSGMTRGAGGTGGGQTVSSALVTLLKNAGTTWSAATIGSQSAAPLELQSDTAVISIGGFTGSDNAPTLAQFEKWVAEGKIHYFIAGGGMGGGMGSEDLTSVLAAIKANGGGTLAISGQNGASESILASNAKVAGISGFSGSESAVSTKWLAQAVSSGRLRWVLVSGTSSKLPGDTRQGSAVAMAAVAKACTATSTGTSSSTGTLYDCAGQASALAATAS